MRRIGVTLALVLLVAALAAVGSVVATSLVGGVATASHDNSLVGTWRVTVCFPGTAVADCEAATSGSPGFFLYTYYQFLEGDILLERDDFTTELSGGHRSNLVVPQKAPLRPETFSGSATVVEDYLLKVLVG